MCVAVLVPVCFFQIFRIYKNECVCVYFKFSGFTKMNVYQGGGSVMSWNPCLSSLLGEAQYVCPPSIIVSFSYQPEDRTAEVVGEILRIR